MIMGVTTLIAQEQPEVDVTYNIQHYSGMYLTLGELDNWNMFQLNPLLAGNPKQEFRLERPLGTDKDTFNIATHEGTYFTLHESNGWDNIAGSDPTIERAQFRLLP